MDQRTIEKLPVESLRALCLDLSGEVERLQDMLLLAKHRRFGASSEQLYHPGMQPLFPELQDQQEDEQKEDESDQEEIEVKSHKRRGGRKRFSNDIPREDVFLDLDGKDRVCDCCGNNSELNKVRDQISEKLHYQPAQYKVIRYIRPLYSCSKCETMRMAPLPPHPLPKTSVTPETIAQIAVAKYMDSLPLYRQSEIFARHGIDISRDKMSRWMIKIGEQLKPLVTMLREHLMSGDVLQMDETGLQVLSEPGREPTAKSFMIVQARGDPPGRSIIIFHYKISRSKDTVRDLVGDFRGTLLTDGLKVYGSLCLEQPDLIAAGCWMHARRRFIDAQKATKKRRRGSLNAKMVGLIDKLFKIEKQIASLSPEKIADLRKHKSKPILEKIRGLIDENIDLYPKKSYMGDALNYLANQWTPLTTFVANGKIQIHNGLVENYIRPFAVGRRNWLFSESPAGAESSAILYSLLVTAKANGLNPYQYFCRILKALPLVQSQMDYEKLLPFNDR